MKPEVTSASPPGSIREQRHGFSIREDLAHLPVRESRIQTGISGPGFERRQLADIEVLAAPGKQQRHYAFSRDESTQERRERIGLPPEFGVGDQKPLWPPVPRRHIQRDSLRPLEDGPLKELMEQPRLFSACRRVIRFRLSKQTHGDQSHLFDYRNLDLAVPRMMSGLDDRLRCQKPDREGGRSLCALPHGRASDT